MAIISEYSNQSKQLLAVDCVIFGYEGEELKLLLFHRELPPEKGKWSLVGGWINDNESVEQAALRVLEKITGLREIFLEQVSIFSKPDRDPGGRVVSVVFYALINILEHNSNLVHEHGAQWWPVTQMPDLIFDHSEMVQAALEQLRSKASYNLVGRDLLPEEFTLTHLRQLYNSIFMRELDPGNFRKKILSLGAMIRLNKKDTSESKKGAFYYRFKPNEEITINERIIKV